MAAIWILALLAGAIMLSFVDFGSSDQTLTGTEGDDTLTGGAGNDTITGLGGNDLITGGSGNDLIDAGMGNDTVYGGWGNDSVTLGGGDDVYIGIAPGNISTQADNDLVYGGDGNDNIVDRFGRDTLYGGDGNDTIDAVDWYSSGDSSTFADLLYGGAGDDTLAGDNGDTMEGGAGADVFRVYVPESGVTPVTITDYVQGTDRVELLVYSNPAAPIAGLMTHSVDGPGNRVLIMVDGATVAILTGTTTYDPATTTISLYS
jgi:Ca2+-binding RTX toxin-like protein